MRPTPGWYDVEFYDGEWIRTLRVVKNRPLDDDAVVRVMRDPGYDSFIHTTRAPCIFHPIDLEAELTP
jgi:hypothetical protein